MNYHRFFYLGFCWFLLVRGTITWQVPPREIMAEITNELGVCVLQILGENSRENVAFSPYGLMSVVFLLYEGSNGNTAIEVYNSLRLPWDRHMARVGFRDLHTHIKSYFTNDRFLRGLVLSKPSVPLKTEYVRLLHYYGFYPGPDAPPLPSVSPADRERPDEYTPTPDLYQPGYTPSPVYPSFSGPPQPPPLPPFSPPGDLFPISPSEPPGPSSPEPEYPTEPSSTDYPYTDLFEPSKTTPSETDLTKGPPPETTQPFSPDFSELFPSTESEGKSTSQQTTVATTIRPTTKTTTEMPTTREDPLFTFTSETKKPPTQEEEDVTKEIEEPLDIDIRFGSTKEDAPTTNKPSEPPAEETTVKPATTVKNIETTSPLTTKEVTESTEADKDDDDDSSSNDVSDDQIESRAESVSDELESRVDNEDTATKSTMTATETIKKFVTTLEERLTTQMTTTEDEETTIANEITKIEEVISEGKSEPTITVSTTATAESSADATSESVTMSIPAVTTVATTPEVNTDSRSSAEMTTMSSPETTSPSEQRRRRRRRRRHLPSPQLPLEHREGNINWEPPPQGPHWVYNVPRDQWFYTYTGGVPVQVLTYMDFLPFAYLEPLNSVAIQLPLDDVRYSMLVLLPVERYGLPQLLSSLHQCPIEQILRSLKVAPVHAVIPAFTVVKHINLVPPLTHAGIESLFDAGRADLSGMANEGPLFVRSIEQLVTVSLRKYHYNSRTGYDHPVANEVRHNFIANHPFIYFVLDTETSAALMAGTMTDPVAYKQQPPP